jgi:hypothetical protein
MYDPRVLTPHDVTREPAASRRAGFVALIAAVLSVALHVWLTRGAFVPITVSGVVEYVFISATARSFLLVVIATGALLLIMHVLVRRLAARHGVQPPLLSWKDVAYVRPLWCFAASALSLLNLVRPCVRFLPVLSYVIVDLRWWWTALVVLWLARNVDARSNGVWRSRLASFPLSIGVRRWFPEVALAAITVSWAVLGTTILRSDGVTIGDEPKYVRYCENLYQGRGFEISLIKPMSELPVDFHPQLWRNVVLLGGILPGELRSLASDAVEYLRNPSHEFNRARHREGGFLDGKNGGMYQVHSPGLSLLMFPAYYLDRTFADIQAGSPAQWPARLRAVNAWFVAIYACWTILIFRFLRACGAGTGVAWIVSLASTLTMPASAFPFQYYPELPAGLFISAVAAHIVFGDPGKPGRSFLFGLLAGYLLWLHLRFIVVVAALAVEAVVLWRGQWRRVFAFLFAVAIPLALFSLYVYRISGSAMPGAVWMAEGSAPNFNLAGMLENSVAYLLDRDWGLFAHSPVFLLALPGYWWLARRKPAIAFLSGLVFLALLLPAAGKTLVQTTPMRLIVAVVPLGATPLIEVLERRSRAVLIAFGLLLIVSLDNALSYNLRHYRHMDTLVDWSFSGWKVNLLFPQESRRPWQISGANGWLLVGWLAVLLTLLCAPAMIHVARERRWMLPRARLNARPIGAQACAAAALFVVLGTAVSAATHAWTKPRYLIPSGEAAQQAALMVDDLRQCTLCVTSLSGPISTQRLSVALDAIDPLVATRHGAAVQREYKEWLAMPGQIRAWYVEATGHDPSDTDIGHHLYEWREEHIAPTEIRRRIFAAAAKAR